jgi:hypothetical protein
MAKRISLEGKVAAGLEQLLTDRQPLFPGSDRMWSHLDPPLRIAHRAGVDTQHSGLGSSWPSSGRRR